MLEAFMIILFLMIFCRLEAILTDRKSISKKKNVNKSLVQDIRYIDVKL